MHEIERRVLITLPTVLGIDLSITNEVVLLWVAAAATFILLTLTCRRRTLVPHGTFQNLFESLVEFIDEQVIRGGIGQQGRFWSPFLLTLFFFILFGNLIGLVPAPYHAKATTSSLSVTAALAAMVFLLTIGINVRHNGMLGFLKKFMPTGIPKAVAILIVPIEVVSWLAKPISLAIRLFANMLVGHALIFVFIGLEMGVAWFLVWLPLTGAVVMSCFEIFVCFIQAFIFTMLAGMYIKDALEEAH